jgi:hypothetical protein
MNKNKQEWKKLEETKFMYELNIKGQLRNVKSKKIKKHNVIINKENIYLGTIPYLTWKYFKGEITHEMILKGWNKLNKYYPEFEGHYFVNDKGQVFNYLTQHFYEWDKSGRYIKISHDTKAIYQHILLARMFLRIPNKYKDLTFDQLQVHHKDENKHNNHISNLEWITLEEHSKLHVQRDPISGQFI